MNYRTIDLASDPRRAHFEYFRTLQYPMLGVTVEEDVTDLKAFCSARGCSFYLAFMHLAAQAANAVPQLRRRIRDGGIVEYEACGTSHVEALADGAYGYCTLWHGGDWDEYLPYAASAREACRQSGSIEEDEDVDALYFITSLPWLHYTQLIQPTAGGDESNPRISWGRFEANGEGRLMLPVTLLVHHALADGVHVAQFYRELEARLRAMASR